jgi:Flp pilus assembly protein TadG
MQHAWRKFCRDTSGSVMIYMGFALIILVGVVGVALDFGTSSMIHTRMQNAADAGALAGALANGNADDTSRAQIARRYFALNYPDNYLESNVSAANVSVQANGVNVVVDTGRVSRDTKLVGVIDIPEVATGASAEVGNFGSTTSQIRDIVLVMDASGSMRGGRIQGAREAADLLITDILCTDPNGSRLGWVDYTADCSGGTGANICSPDLSTLALTNSCASLRSQLSRYRDKNRTNGGDAMEAAETLIAAARTDVVRAVVFMTDGLHNVYRTTGYNDNAAGANAPVEAACSRLKAQGILVYSIAYSQDARASQSMKNCATDPNPDNGYYFYAPDAESLKVAFKQISTSIKKIRITR